MTWSGFIPLSVSVEVAFLSVILAEVSAWSRESLRQSAEDTAWLLRVQSHLASSGVGRMAAQQGVCSGTEVSQS